MSTLMIDGMKVTSMSVWANSRTRKNREWFTLIRRDKKFYVTSSVNRSRGKVFTTADEFTEFFRATFGGWKNDVLAADNAAAVKAKAAAEYKEAAAFNDFVDRIVASGAATLEEVIRYTVGMAREVAATSYARGFDEGNIEGYDLTIDKHDYFGEE